MANIHTDEEYASLEKQYKNDLNKKIKLESELKIKSRQVNRLNHTIQEMSEDLKNFSELAKCQTDIALEYIEKFNKIIILVKQLYDDGKIDKESAISILEIADSGTANE